MIPFQEWGGTSVRLSAVNRSLRIDNSVVGAAHSGTCTACGEKFISHLKDIGDALAQLRRDWEWHDCKEDPSKDSGS